MRLLPIWILAVAALLLTTWPAAAQMSREDIELRDQIYELQQQVQTLQQEIGRRNNGGSYLGQPGYSQTPAQSGGGNDLVAQLLTQVQALEGQVRDLRGRIDETENELKQQSADLNKRIGDLAFQMQNPGAAGASPTEAAPPAGPGMAEAPAGAGMNGGSPRGGPTPEQAPGQTPQMLSPPPAALGATVAPRAPVQPPQRAVAPVRLPPDAAIKQGQEALARHEYPAAEAAARDVLNNYRTSARAYEAQYLLAQALEGQRRYAQAAIAFDDTYNRNRKGSHAPNALLGLAGSLTAINEKGAACDTLAKLNVEFPRQAPSVRQEAGSIRLRAGCR